MNSLKTLLRLLIITQVFALLFLISMPLLLRLLGEPIGRVVYGALALVCIGLALALRYGLNQLQ